MIRRYFPQEEIPNDMADFASRYAECLWLEEREVQLQAKAIGIAFGEKEN